MRKLPLILAAMVAFGIFVPAQAQAFKPRIVYVRATDDNEGIRFSAKVNMDKGGRDQQKVWVTYDGERKEAVTLDEPPLSFYETGPFAGAPVRDCYRVVVKARNQYGTTTRSLRAGRFGTDGCD